MRALLDTHAMYWYIEGGPNLSAAAQTLIQDKSNEVLVSPASYWEIAIKISLGKWKLNSLSCSIASRPGMECEPRDRPNLRCRRDAPRSPLRRRLCR